MPIWMPLFALVGLTAFLLWSSCTAWHCLGMEARMAWTFSMPVSDAIIFIQYYWPMTDWCWQMDTFHGTVETLICVHCSFFTRCTNKLHDVKTLHICCSGKEISVSPQTFIRPTKGTKKNVSQLYFVVLSSGSLPEYVFWKRKKRSVNKPPILTFSNYMW